MDLRQEYLRQGNDLLEKGFEEKAQILFNAANRIEYNNPPPQASIIQRPIVYQTDFAGDKFFGSFGATKDYSFIDYYTLRKRSIQLFEENPYFRGLIRRLVTNEINTGLRLDASPKSDILNIDEDTLQKWADSHETLWSLWSEDPKLCDWKGEKTISEIQAEAKYTAYVTGDCLLVQRISKKTGLPQIEIIDGQFITDPGVEPRKGNTIEFGVELDKNKKHVAYYVEVQDPKSSKTTHRRIPVYGEKSGRRISKLIYGTDRLMGRVRGMPIAAIMLTKFKDLDRAADAELRATLINSMIAGVTTKESPGIGTRPMGMGAMAQGQPLADATVTNGDITVNNNYKTAFKTPGLWIDELAVGEKLESFNTARPNINFAKYEESILNLLCWCVEVPPEIGRLLFTNSFSASRQANNEFKVFLDKQTYKNSNDFNKVIYETFTTYAALTNQTVMPGFLEARAKKDWKTVNAWLCSEWTGITRPSIDILKDVNAGEKAVAAGAMTMDDYSRKISGKSFRTVVKKLQREYKLAEDLGVSLTMNENSSGEPINQNTNDNNQQNNQNNQPQAQAQNTQNIFRILSKLEDMECELEEIKYGNN